jgi:hypothetical protein
MNLIQQLDQFNTAEISDALDACGIEGALLGIKPVSVETKVVGPVFTPHNVHFRINIDIN